MQTSQTTEAGRITAEDAKARLARGEPAYGRRVPALRAVEHHAGTLDQAVAISEEHRRRHATSLPHLSGWIGGHGARERDVVLEVRTAPPPMNDLPATPADGGGGGLPASGC